MKKIFIIVFFFIFFVKVYGDETKPKLSIITSIYNGDEFIESFLSDITKQTIFDKCELILINAASPGNEEKIINEYLKSFSNIFYLKLSKDPGIYAVWNLGIKNAKSDLVCNANIDDASRLDSFAKHVKFLENNPDIDLVYTDYLVTQTPNENFLVNTHKWRVAVPEFSLSIMYKCLPGPRPIWRKSIHEKYGYFDEAFKCAGDLEMWNRAASSGSKFKKMEGVYTLYYLNPNGISSSNDCEKKQRLQHENNLIVELYSQFWQ